MNNDINNNLDNSNNEEFNATLYSEQGENVVKKTDVSLESGTDNPANKKIVIEKQVNVLHKEGDSLKQCQLNLLDQVYRTTIMAIQSIEALQKDIIKDGLRGEINNQYNAYKSIYTRAVDYMLEQGLEAEKTNPITRALRWSSIKINTMTKRSDSNIAEMMVNGTTMGIIEIYRSLNNCSCDDNAMPKPLANELLSLLRSSVDKLAKFL